MSHPNIAYIIGAVVVALLVAWWLLASEGAVPNVVVGANTEAVATE